jgi:CRP-like cAMP-binding protein/Fe-S-cluster-containing hydrogenase component 2
MAKKTVKAMLAATLEGRLMKPADLQSYAIFQGVDLAPLERFPGTISLREFKPGEIVCREGDGGTTAFFIVEGEVDIYITPPGEHEAPRRKSGGIVAALGRLLGQNARRQRPPHKPTQLIPIDATVDLSYGQRVSQLGPGDMFGEMSCLNNAPRSATVVAKTPCKMFEILRNMFTAMQKAPTFSAKMQQVYRERALKNHLRNVSVLEGLSDEDLEKLRQEVELVQVKAGDVIFREGDDADAMYIVRLGHIRVSRREPGGERTLAYLTRGDVFGETGLLRNAKRNATCVAIDHTVLEEGKGHDPAVVELVRFTRQQFEWIVTKYPKAKGRLEQLAQGRIRGQQQVAVAAQSKRVEDLGLLQGQNLMLIDLTKCTRCDQCVDACVTAHDDGVTRLIREGPRYDKYLVPSSCRMCMDPVCMIGCPVGSIRRGENLQILIEDWCIGCGKCAQQCPYDSIQMHSLDDLGVTPGADYQKRVAAGEVVSVEEQAVVCDQCSTLPTGPACVYACPHDAAIRVNAAEFLSSAHVGKPRS